MHEHARLTHRSHDSLEVRKEEIFAGLRCNFAKEQVSGIQWAGGKGECRKIFPGAACACHVG